ncbi:EAL domain-containing protein [Vibrio tubiashii]|uniref:EAL domain-containing protein n=1 Tax=Vibrio tubiashii TaxID=29498 RepID=UPI001EFE0C00|nr:EAL domain-containing protein [Vibrio tubiashii]MCG9575442.1 EAL domain-containing protein [Vibrio tubiashii]
MDISTSVVKAAIQGREIQAAIQPVIDINSNKYHSVEALARLNNVPTPTLIAMADELEVGYMVSLQVFELALRAYCNQPHPININLSPRQLIHPNSFKAITILLEAYNYPPSMLTVELTESPLPSNSHQLKQVIRSLIGEGVRLSLDDFGVEGQCLQRVLELPIQQIKIDRSFITNIHQIGIKQDIVGSIIELSAKHQIEVICEGVETITESDYLKSIGAHLQQGYHWAKPTLIENLEIELDTLGVSNNANKLEFAQSLVAHNNF